MIREAYFYVNAARQAERERHFDHAHDNVMAFLDKLAECMEWESREAQAALDAAGRARMPRTRPGSRA